MIPLTLAAEIRTTILDYLTTTFNFQDRDLERELLAFLEKEQGGLFKGPYIHLRLPFRKVSPEVQSPLTISPAFVPYMHQQRAFERLTTRGGRQPQPTLVTTGTGSGKTECFLYPILDYCYQQRGQPGIKAIILYPMNALASDQSARLGRMIYQDERLRGTITAGLYVGGEGQQYKSMGDGNLIEDRDTIRNNPPDILLTNYKMLDFLLLRPEDKRLWVRNNPETLRFLVLDELHTYDGAQGSDVACLIRRLKARLGTPDGYLCPVGTSATVASEQSDTIDELTRFAGEIFAVPFDVDAVILEDRVSFAEFNPSSPTHLDLPADIPALFENPGEPYAAYLRRVTSAWFGDANLTPAGLSVALKSHGFLDILLSITRDRILSLENLRLEVLLWDPDFKELAEDEQRQVLASFLALIAHARVEDGGQLRPFLTLQVQLWVREMRRLMREVSAKPVFFWRDDVPLNADPRGLPMYFCRECGHSGWLTVMHEGDHHIEDDSGNIYRAYFDHHKNVRYVYPGARSGEMDGTGERLCPRCLQINYAAVCDAQDCKAETFPVVVHRELSTPGGMQQPKDLQRCPICGTDDALSIAGAQSASLSSVAISYIYTSPLNQHKKLLAFTDSVQDAAHRSAFFGARTYRFSMRTAIQAVMQNEPSIPLSVFTDRFFAHWRAFWQERVDCDQHLAATFMPPDLHERANYRSYMEQESGSMPPDLERELRSRLSWEICMEYGFNARLGRSLEKVGSSTAALASERFDSAVQKLAIILPEEVGLLRGMSPAAIRYFVAGVLERTRTRGGVYHPLLDQYLGEQGLWFMLTKKIQPLLSPFHKNSPRFPKFLAEGSPRGVFDAYTARDGQVTWYVDWAQRTLHEALGGHDINDLYRQVVVVLEQEGLLKAVASGKHKAYGILAEVLQVTKETAGIQCRVCGHKLTVPAAQLPDWLENQCLSYRCQGRYEQESTFGQRYYRQVYERGQVERIFPHEHTGLLSRKDREAVELGFKNRARADDPNLLTATPTLELGIDIGDLSSTMACSVPPATANYLQRIGRAGRETGNSLILTLANAKPHDLYFFEDPLEMIAGTIVPPGCFLDAPNMLKRQLLAFCLDTWTAMDGVQSLPRDVRAMLNGLKRGGFPLNFLELFEQSKPDWVERFFVLFGEIISSYNQDELRTYALGVGLTNAVRNVVEAVEAERDDLRVIGKEYRRQVEQIEADPTQFQDPEEEKKRLQQDRSIIIQMIRDLEEQYILNFFTDAGLLPNYAFPESGVKFRGIISGIEQKGADGKSYLIKEYVRPASNALRELAPGNTFYAEERKLLITHLEAPGRENTIEQWQFCDQCSYMEKVQIHHFSTACPSCGSEMWSDQGQKKDMMFFQQAASWTDHYSSLLGDDSDDREQINYETGSFFEINPEFSAGGHILHDLPFGFEYLNQVTLREINFAAAPYMGQTINIASESMPEQGYKVCKGCGLVKPPQKTPNDVAKNHKRSCRFYNKTAEWESLYLYRELTSEALRILLPVSTVLVSEKLVTLEACLELGLRKKFKGNPDHLKILQHMEPAQDGNRRRYLVIYDTVPGGTSFLRDLARPENFHEVLTLALQTMIGCTCRSDPKKQACYRCLYSYRQQRDLPLINRELGIQILSEILEGWDKLQEILTLSDVYIDSLLESELEQRFLDVIQKKAIQTPGWSWKETLYRGKRAWELKSGQTTWLIEPQVLLGEMHNIQINTRADFVFWPQGADEQGLPVAVYTDGFAYHACPEDERGRIGDDLYKRAAVRESGRFVAWSVTWDDVQEYEDETPAPISLLGAGQSSLLSQVLHATGNPISPQAAVSNAVSQLLTYLKESIFENWYRYAGILALSMMSPPRPPISLGVLEEKKSALLTDNEPPSLNISADTETGPFIYGIRHQVGQPLQMLLYVSRSATQAEAVADQVQVTIRLDDHFEKRILSNFKQPWRIALLAANLFQFLPGFTATSTEQIEQYPGLIELADIAPPLMSEDDVRWNAAREDISTEDAVLLTACQNSGKPVPTVGYSLVVAPGEPIIAEAELAWEDDRIAFLLPHQEGDSQVFSDHGWQVYFSHQKEELLTALSDHS
jgi:DEAD/DEAH box helicase domain-containing protein